MTSKKILIGGGVGGVIAAIISAVVYVEGGYVNNPNDPGGETNHGITKAVAVKNGYTGPMKSLPKEMAVEIYYRDYVEKPGYVPFAELSPALTEKLVDAGVNVGPARSSRWLQTSLNALNRGGKDYPPINVDGKVGPATVAAYKGLVKTRGKVGACELVIRLMDAQQANHYMGLDHMSSFMPGWVLNRIGNVPTHRCKE